MNKDVRKFVQRITNQPGVEVVLGGKHLNVLKDGTLVKTLPLTPSDHRWQENALSELRARGITPSHKPEPILRFKERMSLEELAARFRAMQRGEPAAFARFVLEDIPTLAPGLHNYKNVESAAVSISAIAKGKGGASDWAHELLDFSMRAWDRVQAQKSRIDPETVAAAAIPPEPVEAPQVLEVRVNVDQLLGALSELGITVKLGDDD